MRYVKEQLKGHQLVIVDAVEVPAGERFDIPAGEIWRLGDEPVGYVVPAENQVGSQPPLRTLAPVAILNAFKSLGDPGTRAWVEIGRSDAHQAVYWRSALPLLSVINVDDPVIVEVLTALLDINGSDGQPILAPGQDLAILAALQSQAR